MNNSKVWAETQVKIVAKSIFAMSYMKWLYFMALFLPFPSQLLYSAQFEGLVKEMLCARSLLIMLPTLHFSG